MDIISGLYRPHLVQICKNLKNFGFGSLHRPHCYTCGKKEKTVHFWDNCFLLAVRCTLYCTFENSVTTTIKVVS